MIYICWNRIKPILFNIYYIRNTRNMYPNVIRGCLQDEIRIFNFF